MKVLVQRHGIVIKTVPINGDRASIGSGAESDIVIDDPYLPAHMAELVRQSDGWHMVDAATSLDGVLRDGNRIDDEKVPTDALYSVGGFEILVQLDQAPGEAPASKAASSGAAYLPTMAESVAVPRTMMEPAPDMSAREVPKTMFETPMPSSSPPKRPPAQLIQPQIPPSRAAQAAPAAKPKPRRLVIIGVALVLGILLLLMVAIGKGGKKKTEPGKDVATSTAPATTTAPPPAQPPAALLPPQMLEQLKYDDALAAWEAQLATASADPALRQRYADVALEIARIHAANGSPAATRYYEKVAQFGPADSAAVAEAKKKLGR